MSVLPSEVALAVLAIRQQIIGKVDSLNGNQLKSLTSPRANAIVLFPRVVKSKRQSLFRWGQASPEVLFEIAILRVNDQASVPSAAQAVVAERRVAPPKYQAILTYGFVQVHSTAALGNHASTLYGALESLLEVTANELAVRKGNKLAFNDIDPENAVRSAGGLVASNLFEKTSALKRFKKSKVQA